MLSIIQYRLTITGWGHIWFSKVNLGRQSSLQVFLLPESSLLLTFLSVNCSSCVQLCDPMVVAHERLHPWDSQTRILGGLFPSPGSFQQEQNPGLLHGDLAGYRKSWRDVDSSLLPCRFWHTFRSRVYTAAQWWLRGRGRHQCWYQNHTPGACAGLTLLISCAGGSAIYLSLNNPLCLLHPSSFSSKCSLLPCFAY